MLITNLEFEGIDGLEFVRRIRGKNKPKYSEVPILALTEETSKEHILKLLEAGVSAEIHIYSQGGHGYGIRQRGLPISAWRDRFLDWMQLHGFHK